MPDSSLQKKILFTLVILFVYRLGTYISLPFIDLQKISDFLSSSKGGMLAALNAFSGGSISRIAIFGLGVMPYITSSIVMQLAIASFPYLKNLRSEGGSDGNRKIAVYTRVMSFFIGILQGVVFVNAFVNSDLYIGDISVAKFKIIATFLMSVGSMILIWLADMCSARGIGNGTSLIIFTGIVSDVPSEVTRLLDMAKNGSVSGLALFGILLLSCATIAFISFAERSSRVVLVQYPRQAQNFMTKRQQVPKDNFIPFKLNTAGIMPPIFASALLMLPVTIVNAFGLESSAFGYFALSNFAHGKIMFVSLYVLLIVFFSYFYNSVLFDTNEIAENLKKSSVFIPGCRPGAATASFLNSIVTRLSFVGSLYLSFLCIISESLSRKYGNSVLLGGTSMLIVVGVIIDALTNIQTSMMSAKYSKVMRRYGKK